MTTATGRRVVTQQQALLASAPAQPSLPVHNLKLLQVFEPRKLTEEIATCKAHGFTGLLVKALDGPEWMTTYDVSVDAIGSVEEVEAQADVAHLAGLYFFVWTNPLQTSMAVQVAQTAQIARVCDGVFLDVEPYNQFWGPTAPVGRARTFASAIREDAPDAFIALQPDPRPNALAAIRVEEWLPSCDAIAGQHYWSDFGSTPEHELDNAAALGLLYGLPVLPTLPGNAGGTFPTTQISTFPGFVTWRYGTTPLITLITLGRTPVAGLQTDRIRPLR